MAFLLEGQYDDQKLQCIYKGIITNIQFE